MFSKRQTQYISVITPIRFIADSLYHSTAVLAHLVLVFSNYILIALEADIWDDCVDALRGGRGIHSGQNADHLCTLCWGDVLGHVNNGVHGHLRVSLNQAKTERKNKRHYQNVFTGWVLTVCREKKMYRRFYLKRKIQYDVDNIINYRNEHILHC